MTCKPLCDQPRWDGIMGSRNISGSHFGIAMASNNLTLCGSYCKPHKSISLNLQLMCLQTPLTRSPKCSWLLQCHLTQGKVWQESLQGKTGGLNQLGWKYLPHILQKHRTVWSHTWLGASPGPWQGPVGGKGPKASPCLGYVVNMPLDMGAGRCTGGTSSWMGPPSSPSLAGTGLIKFTFVRIGYSSILRQIEKLNSTSPLSLNDSIPSYGLPHLDYFSLPKQTRLQSILSLKIFFFF